MMVPFKTLPAGSPDLAAYENEDDMMPWILRHLMYTSSHARHQTDNLPLSLASLQHGLAVVVGQTGQVRQAWCRQHGKHWSELGASGHRQASHWTALSIRPCC